MQQIRRLGTAVGALALVAASWATLTQLGLTDADAAVVDQLTLDHNDVVYGDVMVVGNAVTGCPSSGSTAASCATGANRTATVANDNVDMVYTQADAVNFSLNSSSSQLTIPSGATVSYAKLSWAGNTGVVGGQAGSKCTSNSFPASSTPGGTPSGQTVKLKVGSEAIVDLTPSTYEFTAEPTVANNSSEYYSADADVTAAFANATTGAPLTVTAGNIWTPEGRNCFGGWGLELVWEFPDAVAGVAPNKREVFIYDGHVRQAASDPDTKVTISDFRVAGGAANNVSMLAYEGDYAISGDKFTINDVDQADRLPSGVSTNFFVSDAQGASSPSNLNNFSIDAKTIEVPSSVIKPGDSTADLTFSTAGDSYLVQALALSVPIPEIQVTKTADRDEAKVGETIEFTITVKNPTDIPAVNVMAVDPSAADCDKNIGDLGPQSETSYTCEVVAETAGTYINTVKVTATNSYDDELENEGSDEVEVSNNPSQASPDAGTAVQGSPVNLTPLSNDTATEGASLDETTLTLLDGSTGDPVESITVDEEGTWTLNEDGTVTFQPLPGFTGESTPVNYSVEDSEGGVITSTLTATITPVTPTADNDAESTPFNTPVTIPVLDNDEAGDESAPLVPGSVQLIDPVSGDPVDSVTVDGEGTWTVEDDGQITFAPDGLTGASTPIVYQVADSNGTTTTAEVTVTVGDGPMAQPDSRTTPQNTAVTQPVLDDDSPGKDATIDTDSVELFDAETSTWGTSLTIDGEGSYTVNDDGTITFAPEPQFTGTSSAPYRFTDSDNNRAQSTYSVTVTPVTPEADDDARSTPFNTPVNVPVLGNDTAGSEDAPLVPGSVQLIDPASGDPVDSVTIDDEGTWTVQPDGQIRFVPVDDFSGDATPVGYQVADSNGTTATAEVTVTVGAAPRANPDTRSTPQNTAVTQPVLDDDAPGEDATIETDSVELFDAETSTWGTSLIIDGEGTYTVNDSGTITFAPEPQFTGTSSAPYRFTDSDDNRAQSTYTITVTPVTPTAVADARTTPFNTPVSVAVVGNDSAGSEDAPLVANSVKLIDPESGDPVTSVTVDGEGIWTVQSDGRVTFAPDDFAGVTTPITYQVADSNGTTVQAQVVVTVGTAPIARPNSDETPQDVNVTVAPLADDSPGEDATIVDTSTQLFDPDTGTWGNSLTIDGEGTYRVNDDGTVTFDPEPQFTGTSSAPYRFTDSDGNQAASTITIVIKPINPTAVDDAESTPFDTPVTLPVLGNDSAGADSAPLVPGSVKLIDPVSGDPVDSVTVDGEGTWTVQPDGQVTFAPDGFTGVTTPITYQVADDNGTTAQAQAVVTVGAGPTAKPDTRTTPQNTPVTQPVLDDDTAGSGATIDAASVQLFDAASSAWVTSLTIDGEGTYKVNAAGTITFTPEAQFTGTSSAIYRFADSDGNMASSTYTVKITPVVPVAVNDEATTPFNTPVGLNLLANDKAGDKSAPLVPGSVKLINPTTGKVSVEVNVPGEGRWTLGENGKVTFTPEPGFTGVTTPLPYQVADANGTITRATAQVTVKSGPTTKPNTVVGEPGQPVNIDVLDNDAPSDGAEWDPTSLCIVASNGCVDRLEIPGEGVWVANDDGTLTFTPEAGFDGESTVTYEITDTFGETVQSTATAVIPPGETMTDPPSEADEPTVDVPAQPTASPTARPTANPTAGNPPAAAESNPPSRLASVDQATPGGSLAKTGLQMGGLLGLAIVLAGAGALLVSRNRRRD